MKAFDIDTAGTLETSLISWWNFEANSTDEFGTDNGTDTAITYSSGNGKIGNGAGFDGSTSKIVLATDSPATNFSFSGWVKQAVDQSGLEPAIFAWDASDNVLYYQVLLSAGRINLATRNPTSNDYRWWRGGTVITDTNWHHIVITQTGFGTPSIYLDNVAETVSINIELGTPSKLTTNTVKAIGEKGAFNSGYWNGAFDLFGIWSKALSTAEISDLYNSATGNAYREQVVVSQNNLLLMNVG